MAGLWYDKKKTRWIVSFKNAQGKQSRKFFSVKTDAHDFLGFAKSREERLRNNLECIDAVPFEEALPLYRAEYLSMQSQTHQRRAYDRLRYLIPSFKNKPLCEIDSRNIENLKRERLAKGLANKTVNEDLTTLSSFFKWAMKRNLAVENPVQEVDFLPKLPRSTRRAYTKDEIERILLNACPCCLPAIAILANTGCRLGELEHLKKEDFDVDNLILRIRHTENTPVKGKENRVVPLNDSLVEVLKTLPDGPILSVARKTFEKHFKEIRTMARVPDAIPHGLRHTYVSHLVASGMDLVSVMRISGHKDIETLQKYLHSTGIDLVPERNRVQFAVRIRCYNLTPIRTKQDKTGQNGQNEMTQNQGLMQVPAVANAVFVGRRQNLLQE